MKDNILHIDTKSLVSVDLRVRITNLTQLRIRVIVGSLLCRLVSWIMDCELEFDIHPKVRARRVVALQGKWTAYSAAFRESVVRTATLVHACDDGVAMYVGGGNWIVARASSDQSFNDAFRGKVVAP